MHDEALELLSAFLDGEEVDPRALADALAHPGAREALREWTLLRAEVRDLARPSPAFYSRMDRALARGEAPFWRRAVPVPWPALAAAGAIVAVGIALAVKDRPELPPTPSRTLTFEEGVEWHGRS